MTTELIFMFQQSVEKNRLNQVFIDWFIYLRTKPSCAFIYSIYHKSH